MDKRFFIALLLTAVVVALTPVLFPTPKRAIPRTAADSARLDSAERAARASGSSAVARPTIAQSPESLVTQRPVEQAPAPLTAGIPRADSLAGVPMVAAETTTVETKKAIYRFTSVGAAPVAA